MASCLKRCDLEGFSSANDDNPGDRRRAAVRRVVPNAWQASVLLGLLVGAPSPAQHGVSAKLTVAIEAAFKKRISRKLESSLALATNHLTTRLGLEGGPFAGYELEVQTAEDSSTSRWRHKCEEVVEDRDSIEYCALRQMHSLAALCDAGDKAERNNATIDLIHQHLKAMLSESLPNLAVSLKHFDHGSDIFFHRLSPSAPVDKLDASPTLQASALMAMVRCADALGEKHYFQEAEAWFQGLQKLYPQDLWNATLVNFHKSGIVWESLSLVLSHLPVESSFHERVLEYVVAFEAFMAKLWAENPNAWSFASARALVIRWRSQSLKKKKQRSKVRKWAREHVDRFLGRKSASLKGGEAGLTEGILARMGGAGYTCGPLQGLTSLAGILADADLVQVVLKLLEKDVDRYQLIAATPAPWGPLVDAGFAVEGSFFRDDQQLLLEKRRTIRVDDPVQCVIALTQALKALDTFIGVEVELPPGDEGAPPPAVEAAEAAEVVPADKAPNAEL
eukprot:TRINITY_DN42920_c0_g1_i1.p1 TRINITY_DN42920_c0_g1~~TRINITY_DN42920_c0_g1_i1.p1  ORF type:complete len:506 (+),score=100.16 TRINITY_DN42920_c0_g1_i1:88-1605(+)